MTKYTLRTINTTSSTSSKTTKRSLEMRSVHPTYLGYVCPISTSDGEKVGLSKQLAITAEITISSSSKVIKSRVEKKIILLEKIIKDDNLKLLKDNTLVYINGDLQGCVEEAHIFLKDIREMRIKGTIDKYCSIHFNIKTDEIFIWVDYGRIIRPLIKVYNNLVNLMDKDFKFKQYIKLTKEHINKLNNDEIKFDDLLNDGIIEYISAEEQENCYLAYNIDEFYNNENNILKHYTHVDIEEAILCLGALTSPFLNHTAPIRVNYQIQQAKQTAGWYILNPFDRYEKKRTFQTYCEIPLIKTITTNLLYPNGINLMVAICSYSGYNQEDSTIINKLSIDNGFMSCYQYSSVTVKINDHNIEIIRLATEQDNIHKKNAIYDYLDERGIIKKGSLISSNTVLVSKLAISDKSEKSTKKFTDKSEIYVGNENIYIDDIDVSYYNPTAKQIEMIKIRYRSYRKIIEGDKFSTRSGNKCILSHIASPSDLPYTFNGEIPDMIINPHSIPGRMSIGQLFESTIAKLAIIKGTIIDGTAFSKFNIDDILKQLDDFGIDGQLDHRMICGKTGRIMKAKIFYTPLYIQHVTKFALEEIYVIEKGPIDEITHQPREGRQNNGGLKLGEMEKDIIASHGSTNVLQEKFINSSDFVNLYFCKKCGSRAIYNEECNLKKCNICEFDCEIIKVNSTHATKVLQEYLYMCGVDMRVKI